MCQESLQHDVVLVIAAIHVSMTQCCLTTTTLDIVGWQGKLCADNLMIRQQGCKLGVVSISADKTCHCMHCLCSTLTSVVRSWASACAERARASLAALSRSALCPSPSLKRSARLLKSASACTGKEVLYQICFDLHLHCNVNQASLLSAEMLLYMDGMKAVSKAALNTQGFGSF